MSASGPSGPLVLEIQHFNVAIIYVILLLPASYCIMLASVNCLENICLSGLFSKSKFCFSLLVPWQQMITDLRTLKKGLSVRITAKMQAYIGLCICVL